MKVKGRGIIMIGMGKPSMAESLGYGREADRDGDGKYTCEKI